MKTLSWKPVKCGKRYCAPACGRGCTMAEHEAARLAGKSLAKTLGKGWTWKVWENLGWHYEAISPCGRIKVTSHNCAFLGEPGCSGGRWAEHGKTPRSAVRNVIAAAKADLAKIGAIIKDL